MKKYFQKLREKDSESKKIASVAIAFWITLIIVVLWILSKSIF